MVKKKNVLVAAIVILFSFAIFSPWGLTLNLYFKVYDPVPRYEIIEEIKFAYYFEPGNRIYVCAITRFYDEDELDEHSTEINISDYLDNFNYEDDQFLNARSRNIGVFKVNLPKEFLLNGCKSEASLKNSGYLQIELETLEHKIFLPSRLTNLHTSSKVGKILEIKNHRGFIYISPFKLRDANFYEHSKLIPKNDEAEHYLLFEFNYDKPTEGNKLLLLLMPFTIVADIVTSPIQHFLLFNSRH